MVSSITLGNYFSSGGRTVFGGTGGSGLDTQSIIKALTDAKSIPATQAQDRIKANSATSSALGEFQTLLSKLKDAANFLRNPPGVNNQSDNIFKYTAASITSNTSVTGSTYLTATTSPGASAQSYTIDEISQLARSKKQNAKPFVVSSADVSIVKASPAASTLTNSGEFKAGTFTLKGVSITLNEGDTLNNVASKFNAVSATTGVSANIIKVSSNSYQLSFVSTQSGSAADFNFNGADLVDGTGVFTQVPVVNIQDAQDAKFKLNGVEITRSTNSIGDAISGVTFTLFQTTPALTTLTVDVKRDEKLIKDGIVNFVNAYNDFKTFFAKQTEVDDNGNFVSTAVLASNSTFRQIASEVSQQVTGITSRLVIAGSGSALAKAAINFSDLPKSNDNPLVRNILSVDEGTLTSIISTNPAEVESAFTFSFSTSIPNLQVFSRTNALGVSNFTINANAYATQTSQTLTLSALTTKTLTSVDADTPFVTSASVDGKLKAGTLTINGQTVTLADGDTLNQVIAKFAAVQADSGVTATLNTVGPGQYSLSFAGNINLNSSDVDPSGVFSQVDLSAGNTAFVSATPANGQLKAGVITVNGQTITLVAGDSLNTVRSKFAAVQSDSGLTPTLTSVAYNQYTLSFTSTVTVGNNNFNLRSTALDPSGVFSKVTINASGSYSASYVQGSTTSTVNFTTRTTPFSRTQTTAGLTLSNSSLGANSPIVFDSPAAGQFKSGTFTFKGSNITLASNDTLNTVAQKFNAVSSSTGVSVEVAKNSSGNFVLKFSSINADATNDFDLNNVRRDTLTDASGVFSQVGPYTTNETNDNVTLTGPVGSALEGLVLIYGDGAAISTNATATQGFGDRVYNSVAAVLDQNVGSIAVELQSIKERDDRLNAQITQINEQVDKYRQQLLDKFAALEQAISRVNSLLASITANNDARNNN